MGGKSIRGGIQAFTLYEAQCKDSGSDMDSALLDRYNVAIENVQRYIYPAAIMKAALDCPQLGAKRRGMFTPIQGSMIKDGIRIANFHIVVQTTYRESIRMRRTT